MLWGTKAFCCSELKMTGLLGYSEFSIDKIFLITKTLFQLGLLFLVTRLIE